MIKTIINFIILLAFDAPFRGFPSEYRYPLWDRKTRMVSLPDGEKISKIGCTVWPQCTRVTTNQRRHDTAYLNKRLFY